MSVFLIPVPFLPVFIGARPTLARMTVYDAAETFIRRGARSQSARFVFLFTSLQTSSTENQIGLRRPFPQVSYPLLRELLSLREERSPLAEGL